MLEAEGLLQSSPTGSPSLFAARSTLHMQSDKRFLNVYEQFQAYCLGHLKGHDLCCKGMSPDRF